MILDHDRPPSDALRLSEQQHGIGRMVENIDEKNRIDTVIREWKLVAVVGSHRNGATRSCEHVEALDAEFRLVCDDPLRYHAVAATDIQRRPGIRQQASNMVRQNSQPPIQNETLVRFPNPFE